MDASWGTSALLHRSWNMRCALRGSTKPPCEVVKTRPFSRHREPAANRSSSCRLRCALKMFTNGAGLGSTATDASVFTGSSRSCPSPRCSACRTVSLAPSRSTSAQVSPSASLRRSPIASATAHSAYSRCCSAACGKRSASARLKLRTLRSSVTRSCTSLATFRLSSSSSTASCNAARNTLSM